MNWRPYFTASSDPGAPPPSPFVKAINCLIVGVVLGLVCYATFARLAFHLEWSVIWDYRAKLLRGWLVTVVISAIALVCSALIGLVFALMQRAEFLPLRYFGRLYVEIIRGTPLVAQILVFYFVVFSAAGLQDRYVSGVLILSIFSGAYITEIFRAGIESVGKSQLESARAIGFNQKQIYRHVIFPQAIRQILPPLAGQFVSLVKDSSLLCIISIGEFTNEARSISELTYRTLEAYVPLAIGYLILTVPISLWTRHLERRLKFET